MKKLLMLLLVLGLISCIALYTAQTEPEKPPQPAATHNDDNNDNNKENRKGTPFESFVEPNPKGVIHHRYIWTDKQVYTVGEPIKLFIEVMLRDIPGAERHAGNLTVRNPLSRYALRVYKEGYGFLILWSEKYPSEWIGGWDLEWACQGDYVPTEDEIDKTKLHGRLVMPKRPDDAPEIWEVNEQPGCSFVLKINDITKLWYLCHSSKPDFDERGKYKVQYWYSNIIEFEIR